MIYEIDVQKEFDFFFREVAFCTEETPIQRLRAGAFDGVEKVGAVVRSERADFDLASVAQHLDRRIFGCGQHLRTPPTDWPSLQCSMARMTLNVNSGGPC